jgi:hypothetical protein
MSFILRNSHVARASVSRHIRSLATPAATSGSSAPKKETFKDTLEQGPSLDDFVSSGDIPERVVLGNTKTYVTLLYSRENNGLTSTLEVALACLPI